MTVFFDLESARQLEVQAIGAAISNKSWHAVETAYNSLRDRMDRVLHQPRTLAASTARPTERGAVICEEITCDGNPCRTQPATDQAAEVEAIGTLLRRLSNPLFQWSREQRRDDCLLIQRLAGLPTQRPTGSTMAGEEEKPKPEPDDWWGRECSTCTLPRRDCECN